MDSHIIHITNVILTILLLTSGYASGYKSVAHDVVTEDGYILQIFRISTPRCPQTKAIPVILMHGLLLNSKVWFDAGPRAGLAYHLYNECYDIWLGNVRGNSYSRRHQHLNPDTDSQFWKFSVDEIGKYDIPATIDYVLEKTGAAKVNYIGFSQGCGSFYIMCSERPAHCDKVGLKISLAPATRHLNTKGQGFRNLVAIFNRNLHAIEAVGLSEALKIGGFTQLLGLGACQFPIAHDLCFQALGYIDAPHPQSVTLNTLKRLLTHVPAGTSAQNLARYGQSLTSQDFVKFDYGAEKNRQVYGSDSPPAHNLGAVTVPVVIMYGNNDGIVDQTDVEWAASKMPNVVGLHKVDDDKWNHFDMTYSQYAPEKLFPNISAYLSTYTNM